MIRVLEIDYKGMSPWALPIRAASMALPGRLLSQIAPLLAVMRHLNTQLAYSDEAIEHIAVQDPLLDQLAPLRQNTDLTFLLVDVHANMVHGWPLLSAALTA